MNKGVEILLQRMDSNPDEFKSESIYSGYPKKWGAILEKVQMRVASIKDPDRTETHYKYQLPFLTNDDILAVWAKLNELHGDQFTKQVMGILLAEEEEEAETLRYQASGRYGSGSGNYHHSSLLGNTPITPSSMLNQSTQILQAEMQAAHQQKQYAAQAEYIRRLNEHQMLQEMTKNHVEKEAKKASK